MNPKRKPWYRTKGGVILSAVFSPFWFIWKKSRPNRFLRTLFGGTAALIIFIGIIAFAGHLFKPGNHTNEARAITASASLSGRSPVLYGYGARLADWNATHTTDNGLATNTAYNPTSGLGNDSTDKYTRVVWINGRALGYRMSFPEDTSIHTAKALVMEEFRGDATIIWQQQNKSDPTNTCYQMEIHSYTLGRVLQTDGDAFVEFQTITANDMNSSLGYDSSNVNSATLRSNTDYKIASSVGNC